MLGLFEKIVVAFGTFIGAFLVQAVIWAGVETLGYGHVPLAQRQMVLYGMVTLCAVLAVWRWRRTSPANRSGPVPDSTGEQAEASARTATLLSERFKALAMEMREADAPRHAAAAPDIAAARRQAIVFRQIFPPPHSTSLTFWGGAPIMPPGFAWPRDKHGAALGFVMQIDCRDIPEAGRLGLMPASGALYFFLDLEWGNGGFQVIHLDHPNPDWAPLSPPADLVPAFGQEAKFLSPWAVTDGDLPRLLPKWPFVPLVLNLPDLGMDDEDDGLSSGGDSGNVFADALLTQHGGEGVVPRRPLTETGDGAVSRPFADFPQDWRALQILAAAMLDWAKPILRRDEWKSRPGYKDLSAEERRALFQGIVAEAEAWRIAAGKQPPFDAVPRTEKDAFWDWVERHGDLARYCFDSALRTSIEFSLTASAASAARIPPDMVERVASRHALAVKRDGKVEMFTPDRMLAAPSDIQGNQLERAMSHLLLLEMSSDEGLFHHFGEGVYQFWITPENLRQRRFDKVVLTMDAH